MGATGMPAAGGHWVVNESVKKGLISMNGAFMRQIDHLLFTFNTARRRACVAEDRWDQSSTRESVRLIYWEIQQTRAARELGNESFLDPVDLICEVLASRVFVSFSPGFSPVSGASVDPRTVLTVSVAV